MFKVGDKVRVVSESSYKEANGLPVGYESVVLAPNSNYGDVLIQRDDVSGHEHYAGLAGIAGKGWYVDPSRLEIITSSKDTKEDVVNSPKHYTQGKIEVIDFIEDQKLDFRAANVVKYTCRARYKGKELEDYKKARFYLDRLIKELEKDEKS
jgi:hypothetical protein